MRIVNITATLIIQMRAGVCSRYETEFICINRVDVS